MVLSDTSRAIRASSQALGASTHSHLVTETLPFDEHNMEWNLPWMTEKVINDVCLCQGSIKDMIGAPNEKIDAPMDMAPPVDEEIIKDVVNDCLSRWLCHDGEAK